jgi:hypothetical protein
MLFDVPRPNVVPWRPRVVRYPAPLCDTCSVPMAFNGEYGLEDGVFRREYQCPICREEVIVLRMVRSD